MSPSLTLASSLAEIAAAIGAAVIKELWAQLPDAARDQVDAELAERLTALAIDSAKVATLGAAGVDVTAECAALRARALTLEAAGLVNVADTFRDLLGRIFSDSLRNLGT